MLSTEEVENRAHRAIMTLYALPEPWTLPRVRSGMPDYMREFVESYGSDGARSVLHMRAKFVPERQDIDDMYEAFEWWRGIAKEEYQLLEARAFKFSYDRIASIAGDGSREYWRYRYKALLEKMSQCANKIRKSSCELGKKQLEESHTK